MPLPRRLRGALGTALTWSVAAAALHLVVGLFALAFTTGGSPAVVVRGTAGWAGLGFVAGLAFAGAVLALARHRTLDRLSTRRVALWGFAAGALLPAVSAAVLATAGGLAGRAGGPVAACLLVAATGLLGAGMAAASLRAARRGPALPAGRQAGLARP
jgi:hypothetical protein